jgi:topoisomerase-4 subunit A
MSSKKINNDDIIENNDDLQNNEDVNLQDDELEISFSSGVGTNSRCS